MHSYRVIFNCNRHFFSDVSVAVFSSRVLLAVVRMYRMMVMWYVEMGMMSLVLVGSVDHISRQMSDVRLMLQEEEV